MSHNLYKTLQRHAESGPTPDRKQPGFSLQTTSKTFGILAVEAANRQATQLQAMSELDVNSDEYLRYERTASFFGENIADHIAEVRETLNAMAPESDNTIDDYFTLAIPKYMLDAIIDDSDKEGRQIPWREWITRSDDRLLNVLQWHNHIIEQQSQSDDVEQSFQAHKELFMAEADKLYQDGYLALPPKDVEAKLIVGDLFDTLVKNRTGYYKPGTAAVVVTQGIGHNPEVRRENLKKHFPAVLTHEFVHLFLNRSLDAQDSPMASVWLNEALTETINRNIRKGFGDDVKKDKTYEPERKLLISLIAKSSDQEATLRLATKAFSGDASDRKAFLAHIDTVWGAEDVIEKIDAAIASKIEQLPTSEEEAIKSRVLQMAIIQNVQQTLNTAPDEILRVSIKK